MRPYCKMLQFFCKQHCINMFGACSFDKAVGVFVCNVFYCSQWHCFWSSGNDTRPSWSMIGTQWSFFSRRNSHDPSTRPNASMKERTLLHRCKFHDAVAVFIVLGVWLQQKAQKHIKYAVDFCVCFIQKTEKVPYTACGKCMRVSCGIGTVLFWVILHFQSHHTFKVTCSRLLAFTLRI